MRRIGTIRTSEYTQGALSRLYNRFSRPYLSDLIAEEISSFSRYFDRLVQIKMHPETGTPLYLKINNPNAQYVDSIQNLPDCSFDLGDRTVILLNGSFNHHFDVAGLLLELRKKANRSSRVCVVVYNTYWRWLYSLANTLGIRQGELPTTYFTHDSLSNICSLADFEIVRLRPVAYFPLRIFGLGTVINRTLQACPILRWLAFTEVLLLRPIISTPVQIGLSVIVPARNERGNIENVVSRSIAALKFPFELIFVEGHSSDQTWEEIQKVQTEYAGKAKIRSIRQTGTGKNDAVRIGFSNAEYDLVTILDADLSVPPELLPRFYDAYLSGKADFINGSRLVYPMEGGAMRFLNWLGNVFFAKMLSWALDTRLGDTLCGTKLMSKHDYDRFTAWRKDFGDFDPFGDFELLFPAAVLGLGIKEVPLRYKARVYGSTNISRFKHGSMLLQMALVGFFRIRMSFGANGLRTTNAIKKFYI